MLHSILNAINQITSCYPKLFLSRYITFYLLLIYLYLKNVSCVDYENAVTVILVASVFNSESISGLLPI